jgi:hypothetical protein
MATTKEIMGLGDAESAVREACIRAILQRGKAARFTNMVTGVTKDVCAWETDEHGDLTAFRTSPGAKTACVGWRAVEYAISEIDGPTPVD